MFEWLFPTKTKKIGVSLCWRGEIPLGVDVTFGFRWWTVTYHLPMTTARALHEALDRAIIRAEHSVAKSTGVPKSPG